MSREYTVDEIRDQFLDHVRSLIKYWEIDSRAISTRDKLDGLAFSILSALDGSSANLPGFIVAPNPHPDDMDYHKSQDVNWYPQAPEVPGDIGGCLHELLFKGGKHEKANRD